MADPEKAPGNKLDEVHFLTDNFDIPPLRAAQLVADRTEVDELAEQAMVERQRDPLAAVPVPDPEKAPEHNEKEIGDLHKPVVHDRSAPT
ncbi:MAG TPA: hypothetical protein VGN60_12670 [Devosia sp.]|nr:hypothetical protein [Devosia sp.]